MTLHPRFTFLLCLAACCSSLAVSQLRAEDKLHLFILSGQSNMAGLNPQISFTPTVTEGLTPDDVVVVKDAHGGQPIRRWYKMWKPAGGGVPKGNGDLYDRLMAKVRPTIARRKPDTITFVWMQGERDARNDGDVYEASLQGLIEQLRADLGRPDVNVVVGRLSDFGNGRADRPHWDTIRKVQAAVCEADKRSVMVDTDDLNGPKNGLHYTKDGYKTLGKRFAEAAIGLVNKSDG